MVDLDTQGKSDSGLDKILARKFGETAKGTCLLEFALLFPLISCIVRWLVGCFRQPFPYCDKHFGKRLWGDSQQEGADTDLQWCLFMSHVSFGCILI